MIEPGAVVFFQDVTHSWIVGTVEAWDGNEGSCRANNPKEGTQLVTKLKEAQIFVAREDIIAEDVDDLLNLTVLHDATLLNCLKRRYMRDTIYTNIGAIVVALNPFNYNIPWYKDEMMGQYLNEGDVIEKNLPHSWAVAHNTYFEMRNDRANQCILVSGESGAGKTEASKIVMKYLAAVSCKTGTPEQQGAGRSVGVKINLTSPPLEAFGNAKTVRNDNSSRFGKFMKVKFDDTGCLIGAHITKYLLEKSRIVIASENERCYHALYLVVRGPDAPRLQCEKDSQFRVLTSGHCVNNKEFDTKEEAVQVSEAMKTIGLSGDEVDGMWATVAAILHFGNVQFQPNGEGSIILQSSEISLATACHHLEVDLDECEKELLTTILVAGQQAFTKVLNPTAAMDAKEALMKSLYDCAFQWLVDKCNSVLNVDDGGRERNWIGLLDIFGFEDFEVNSFEQLCINLANETLQGHYNAYIFQKDLDECRAEGVDMSMVTFPDNEQCLAMIAGRGGLIALLDDECSLGKGSDEGFLQTLTDAVGGENPFFVRKLLQKTSFTIRHYAGDVTYEVAGFLDKNRDTLKDAFKTLMRKSGNTFVANLLPEPVENARKITVGGYFRNQLRDLMEVLNATNPHWIRCIKPHPAKKPLHFHGVNVTAQLSSSGVLGTVKIRKAGYPVRIKHADFVGRYNILGRDTKSILACDKRVTMGKDVQIGTVRVFLKSDAYQILEYRKKHALHDHACNVQAFALAWNEIAVLRQKQRELNKELYNSYRGIALKLLALDAEEDAERQSLAAKFTQVKQVLRVKFDAELKVIAEECRRKNMEKLRLDYERKQRQDAANAERQRIEKLRQEARDRKLEEQRTMQRELAELEAKAVAMRCERHAREVAMSLATKAALEEHLQQQSAELMQERQRRREEDKAKAEAAKARRTAIQQAEIERLQQLAAQTDETLIRGEMLKECSKFERKQQYDEHQLKMEARRLEVKWNIGEEERATERYRLMQIAVGEARQSFMEARKKQIEKDNCVRHHLQHIERKEQQQEVEILRDLAHLREHKVQAQTRNEMCNVKKTIETLERRGDIARREAQKIMMPVGGTASRVAREQNGVLASVRRDLAKVGDTAFHSTSATSLSMRDATRSSVRRPVPKHIDPALFSRVSGRDGEIIAKYGTSVVPTQASSLTLPWKL